MMSKTTLTVYDAQRKLLNSLAFFYYFDIIIRNFSSTTYIPFPIIKISNTKINFQCEPLVPEIKAFKKLNLQLCNIRKQIKNTYLKLFLLIPGENSLSL